MIIPTLKVLSRWIRVNYLDFEDELWLPTSTTRWYRKILPESAEENDIVLVGNALYFWCDTWHEIINYEESFSKMIRSREAEDSEIKRETLEKINKGRI